MFVPAPRPVARETLREVGAILARCDFEPPTDAPGLRREDLLEAFVEAVQVMRYQVPTPDSATMTPEAARHLSDIFSGIEPRDDESADSLVRIESAIRSMTTTGTARKKRVEDFQIVAVAFAAFLERCGLARNAATRIASKAAAVSTDEPLPAKLEADALNTALKRRRKHGLPCGENSFARMVLSELGRLGGRTVTPSKTDTTG